MPNNALYLINTILQCMDIHIWFIIFILLKFQIGWVVMGNVMIVGNRQWEVKGWMALWGLGAMDNGGLRGERYFEGWGQWAIGGWWVKRTMRVEGYG